MLSKIKVLPDHLINQIAAGEVVEDAPSAVKELVENALDAGAKRIVVELEKGGYQRLAVIDDGRGMTPDDAVLCFERHATSKIREPEDLFKLSTMGFRGEALAAIASVSKVTLSTATEDSDGRGTQVEIAAGRILNVAPCGRSAGTSVEVNHLFYNAPARRKYQPSPASSENATLRLMNAFALGYPQMEFILQADGKQIFFARGIEGIWMEAAKKRMQEVLGEDQLVFEQPVEAESNGCTLTGFLGPAYLHRKQRSGQYLFVEGRYVFSSLVSRSVREAFSTRIPEGRHPLFVLYLRFPPGDVDVNVHPQKKEVRFRDETFLSGFIQHALQKSFLRGEYSPFPPSLSQPWPPAILPWDVKGELEEAPSSEAEPLPSEQMELPYETLSFEAIGLFGKYLIAPAESLPSSCPLFLGKEHAGMVLIDLSLAGMRIAFEELLKIRNRDHQRLLIPRKLQLPKLEAERLQNCLADLQGIGLEIQRIGPREFAIEAMPNFWDIGDVEEAVMASLEEVEREACEKNLTERLALRASGFARWNKGSLEEAKGVMKRLLICKEPYFSPRGKPVMALLDERLLERLFHA